ncbi:MAG: hypothetical protein KGM46_04870 [Pseudomonadota bacterium]|jgi:hypothetical protein|nr:hypothetical protein [Xanthomonadaceae bacterium]MDE2249501.1 hypothetical protein [Xanthomonadaceae bacterium]MDE3210053.1 hypothetical protein [Pseudomonadota bacterium]
MDTTTLLFGIPTITLAGWALVKRFFGDYLSEKGKNQATREDIAEITRIVEGAKQSFNQDFARLTEELRAQTSLRMLAAEKRLEAHQEVYQLWRQLVDGIHSEDSERRQLLKQQCLNFHFTKCLYLDSTVREAFIAAITSFDIHPDLLRSPQINPMIDRTMMTKEIQDNFRRVERLGKAITDACELPAIAGKARTFTDQAPTRIDGEFRHQG